MKHKTWFRLVLKAIGVALIGVGLPEVVSAIFLLTGWLRELLGSDASSSSFYTSSEIWIGGIIGTALQFALGFYLLFGGEWLVNKCIPSNRPYCPECGYDVSRTTAEMCPECGIALLRKPTDQAEP